MFGDLLLLGATAVAVIFDLRFRRIPNSLTLSLAGVGIATGGLTDGWGGLVTALQGFGVGLALFFLPFVLGWLGGGDVKLMAAVGAFLGPVGALYAGVYGAMAGGVMAVAVLLGARRMQEAGRWAAVLTSLLWLNPRGLVAALPAPGAVVQDGGSARPIAPAGPAQSAITLPYAVAIAAGLVLFLWFGPAA